MSSSDLSTAQLLQRALSISREILQQCVVRDWQGLDRLEYQRQELLQQLQQREIELSHRDSMIALIECNEQIVDELKQQRSAIHQQHRQYRLSKQASRAYQHHR